MFVKIMSDENCPDFDTRKSFKLLSEVESISFDRRGDDEVVLHVHFKKGEDESFLLVGNVYVMNDAGKTIEKFGPHPIP